MQRFSVSQLSNPELTRGLVSRIANDRVHTAELLAYLAEFDARQLYLPAGYPSMHAYCRGELRLSEDATEKRITVARLAVRYPAILERIADGRLHLSGVVQLSPHLHDETAAELLEAATHRSKAEIDRVIAERFPRRLDNSTSLEFPEESQALAEAVSAPGRIGTEGEPAPGRVEDGTEPAPGRVDSSAAIAPAAPSVPRHRARITPIGPGLHELRVTIGDAELEQLRHAQNLLSYCVRRGDVTEVLRRALNALVAQLEERRFAAASKPRAARPGARLPRTIPAHVRRAVWERDGGRCTFVSESGHRCEARSWLEFDHVVGVAQGGEATVDNVRLLCRPHNQHEAERAYGSEFMRARRGLATEARRAARRRRETEAQAQRAQSRTGDTESQASRPTPAGANEPADPRRCADELIPWLRSLGIRSADATRAAESVALPPNARLEDRVKAALAFHGATRGKRTGRLPGGYGGGDAAVPASAASAPGVAA